MEIELIRGTLTSAKTGWYRLLGLLGLVNLALLIDLLTGAQFLSDSENIKIVGLEVPRIAFSLIYTILFSSFIAWAVISTKITSQILCSYSGDISQFPEFRLWLLSPISQSRLVRALFWLLAADGLVILASVSAIHLFGILTPDTMEMSTQVYFGIGWFCTLMFAVTLTSSIFYIYPKWLFINIHISENGNNRIQSDAAGPHR